MSQITFAKILTSGAAVLLLGAGAASAGNLYDPQNAAQALLAHTISPPAHAVGSTAVHGMGRGDDAQELARLLLLAQQPKSSGRRVVVASSSPLSNRNDASSPARRMIAGGGA
jgi:hypothetical protein